MDSGWIPGHFPDGFHQKLLMESVETVESDRFHPEFLQYLYIKLENLRSEGHPESKRMCGGV